MSRKVLDLTQEKLVKELGYPYFTTLSHNIQVLKSPIDFYLALCKGIRISHKRIILSSLYIGDGPLEMFLIDQLFNKIEVNKSLRLSILLDFHRGHRGKNHTSVNLCLPLKANFQPNHNVRVGFYKPFHQLNFNAFLSLQEARGVQHTKIAVFDDHVLLTGANLSDSYFTDREDRWALIQNVPDLANYCDDLTNSLIDVSFQMDDEGKLILPRNLPKPSGRLRTIAKDRVKLFKFMQEEKPEIKVKSKEDIGETKNITQDLQVYQNRIDSTLKLKKALKSEDVFNVLKDMPHELNVITGDGGWKNQVIPTGEVVHMFPSLQMHQLDCNDDLEYLKSVIPLCENLAMASGYMAFPPELLKTLEKVKKLELISASPQANGFLNDGIKHWIPYFYRANFDRTRARLKHAEFFEYFKDAWTFHAKGLWASDHQGVFFTSLGSSNFSSRSYFRDAEFQLYLWSDCRSFKEAFSQEKQRVWQHGFNDPQKFPLPYSFPTKILARLLKSFL